MKVCLAQVTIIYEKKRIITPSWRFAVVYCGVRLGYWPCVRILAAEVGAATLQVVREIISDGREHPLY